MSGEPPKVPTHVGLILDGNRRWARANGLPSLKGHLKGYNNLHDIGHYLIVERKIPYVSAYIFSTENWNRTKEEVGYLMRLVTKALSEYLEEFNRDGVKIQVLGTREGLSKTVLKAIEKAENSTANNQKGTLALCFNYGGHQEIVDGVNRLLTSKPPRAELTKEDFEQFLYYPEVPPIDLIVRTSGEQRLSGFMLWRSAYAELLFTNKHWPDFSVADAEAALAEYARRHRRFGA